MSQPTKPVLVFVPGAWHPGRTWDTTRKDCEAHGFETHYVDLASVGLRSPVPKFPDADSDVIREKVKSVVAEGKDVFLVFHSYGGTPGTNSVQGLEKVPGEREHGIVGCVFAASQMLCEGDTMSSASEMGRKMSPDALGMSRDDFGIAQFSEGGVPEYFYCKKPHHYFYQDVSLEEAQPWIDDLRPHAMAAANSPIKSVAWKSVPCTMIFCLQDNAYQLGLAKVLVDRVEKAGPKFPIRKHEIDCSHTPWLRHVPELSKMIRDAAMEHKLD